MDSTLSSASQSERLKQLALEEGFLSAGICAAAEPQHYASLVAWVEAGRHGEMSYMERHLELRRNPAQLLEGAKSVLCVALNYAQEPNKQRGATKVARYALGRDYHLVVRSRLKTVMRSFELEYGPVGHRICVDSAPLLERDLAQRAGLGWFGKNTMLIDSRFGSWFVLGFVLLEAELSVDLPAVGGCGTCSKCVDECPTGAIIYDQHRWQVDARRCISYLTIELKGDFTAQQQSAISDWTFGCDVCQEVCPFNTPRESQPARSSDTQVEDFLQHRKWPSLADALNMSEEEWDRLSQGSAVRRAGLRGFKRNARANLRNQVVAAEPALDES